MAESILLHHQNGQRDRNMTTESETNKLRAPKRQAPSISIPACKIEEVNEVEQEEEEDNFDKES